MVLEKSDNERREPQIQNVVSLAKLSENEIDLSTLAEKLSNSHYNPKRFPAVIFKKSEPKSTVLVFRSGKLIIIGSKSEEDADRVSKFAAKRIG
jgi:transcription initiation factor TFIID TATA-box-binding protein